MEFESRERYSDEQYMYNSSSLFADYFSPSLKHKILVEKNPIVSSVCDEFLLTSSSNFCRLLNTLDQINLSMDVDNFSEHSSTGNSAKENYRPNKSVELFQNNMTSTEATEEFFPWNNDLKVEFNNVKPSDESASDLVSCSGSEPSVVSSSASRKRKWDCENKVIDDDEEEEETKKQITERNFVNPQLKHLQTDERSRSRMPSWQVESIEDMAADLDGSLSGLGVDLSTASYNMSEALLSLPSLTVFKQEAPSPSADSLIQQSSLNGQSEQHLQHLLQNSFNSGSSSISQRKNCPSSGGRERKYEDCRFQYILAAATSIATKVSEETLTYLNQGQSYEIKLKKVGELSHYRGKIFKSIIRICFHERRMQYMEKEQILAWQASRPGERIVEMDLPLSYGLFEVVQDPSLLNTLSFLWDPTKEVGAYIKVNCISTEFTPKKHGGEKGVPFRIQVETFIEGEPNRLHAAACQIKVFKLKGADRKHKQDREKIQRRPPTEQEKYQPSYECTVLTDLSAESIFPAPAPISYTPSPSAQKTTVQSPERSNVSPQESNHVHKSHTVGSIEKSSEPSSESESNHDLPIPLHLTKDSTAQQTCLWLQRNSFENYIPTFTNFTGADLLRLTREDLIQICGLADGIRLLYALHSKAVVLLTLYINTPCSGIYNAIYLDHMGRNEICCKLATFLGIQAHQIIDLFLQGPNGIHILITDEVIRHIKDESMFTIDILKDNSGERFRLLLKPA